MEKKKILIVEDEPIIASDIKKMLGKLDYDVSGIVSTADDAVAEALKHKPDLVLMDIKLKGNGDGIDAARIIKKNQNVPILYITAFADEQNIARSRDTDSYGFLSKPIKFRDLNSHIYWALHKHEMEQRVKKSEERYRRLVENMPSVVFSLDLENIIQFSNSQIEQLTSYRISDLIGSSFIDLIHEEDKIQIVNILKNKIISSGEEFRIISKYGDEKWVRANFNYVFFEGNITNIEGIMIDVTEKKEQEIALRDSELLFRSIAHKLPNSYLSIINRDLTLGFTAGKEFAKLNLDPKDFIGKSLDEVFQVYGSEVLETVKRNYQLTFEGEETVFELEMANQYQVYNTVPLPDKDGAINRILSVVENVTDRKYALDALIVSEQKFSKSFYSSPFPRMIMSLPDGRIIDINDAFISVYGYEREEVLGEIGTNYGVVPDLEENSNLLKKLLSDGYVHDLKFDFKTKNGKKRIGILYADIFEVDELQFVFIVVNDITEKLKAEEDLHTSEKKHRNILENMEEGYFELDLNGNFTFFNDSICRILGYAREELVGMNNRKFMSSETMKKVHPIFKTIYESGESCDVFDYEVTRKDGSKSIQELSAGLLTDDRGKPIGFHGIARDITQKKIEEEALQRSEEMFRNVVTNVKEYIYDVEYRNGEVESSFHSPLCEDISGYVPNEFYNNPNLWLDIVYEEDRDMVDAFFHEERRKKGGSGSLEHRINHKDGSVRWVLDTCSVLLDESGVLERESGFIIDITERKDAEHELRLKDVALRTAAVAIAITDADGNITFFNDMLARMWQLDEPENIIGKSVLSLLDIDSQIDMIGILTETGIFLGELQARRFDGTVFFVDLSASVIRDKFDKLIGLIFSFSNITMRKNVEHSLRQREEKLRESNFVMKRDLQIAQKTQRELIIKANPESNFIKVDYRYYPLEEVGGDYFAFYEYDEKSIGVFIGDVSGHGVASALFLSLIKSVTDKISEQSGHKPSDFVSQLNEELCGSMTSYFITGIYGVFEKNTESGDVLFTFSNGGHPSPIIIQKESRAKNLPGKNTLIGISPGMEYFQQKIKLSKGDRLYLLTDGIPETENEERVIIDFDVDLLEIFNSVNGNNVSDSLDGIIDRINQFRGQAPLRDDIMLIGFEIL